MDEAGEGFNVKITDDELKGRYSNLLRITHTREEFILDFINLVPPQGIVTAPDVLNAGLDAADAAPDSDGLITSLHADYLVCVPW